MKTELTSINGFSKKTYAGGKMRIEKHLENKYNLALSAIAKEPVSVRVYEDKTLFAFGSELACLRLAQAYKQHAPEVKYSTNLKTHYINFGRSLTQFV